MQNFFKGKKILLTGHTGFKGSWLALILKHFEAEVYGYSLAPDEHANAFFNLINLEKIIDKSTFGNICDLEKFKVFYEDVKPDIIFHLAAQPFVLESYKDPLTTYHSNAIGVVNLFEIVRTSKHKPKVVLNVTTDKCYENKEWPYPYRESDRLGGHDPYSASKAISELITKSYRQSFFNDNQVKIITARGGNVIGGGDFGANRIIPDLIKAIQSKQILKIRNPNAIRPWQHIFDVLNGYLTIVKYVYNNEEFSYSYNIGPEHNHLCTVKELLDKIQNNFSYQAHVQYEEIQMHEAKYLKLDISLAKTELNWHPKLTLPETLRLTAEWYNEFLNKQEILQYSVAQINNFFYAKV